MPAVIIAENVRGLRPYLPVLRLEYERHGYTAHIEMFNSKYWNVPQNRDRYAVVGTRNKKNLSFTFPKEQHEFVPKLSDYLEKDVPEKYYLPDEKAQTIIAQAMEKLEKMGKCHACITPDRINKRQNGPRAQNAVNDMLSKYAPGGYMGKIIYPLLTPLKERLEAGERTPDLYNAIVEATR